MQWSVVLEADGDREVTRRGGRRARRRGGPARRGRLGHRHDDVRRPHPRRGRVPGAGGARPVRATLAAAARAAGLPAVAGRRCSTWSSPDDDERGPRMIRLGLAGGVPVRGPAAARRLDAARERRRSTSCCAGPSRRSNPDRYAVIYVGHADDLSTARLPVPAPAGRLLGTPRRRPLEGPHRDVRGPRRATVPTASRSPRS